MAVVMMGIFQRACVVGHSMNPTLEDGQNYLVLRTALNPIISVRQGDIVIAKQADLTIVKRVIGCPGDTLEIQNGRVYLNGNALDETYICEPMRCNDLPAITLGQDQYFLMGDNRNYSADSRVFGTFSSRQLYAVLYKEQQPQILAIYIAAILAITLMACSLHCSPKEVNTYGK